MVLKEDLMFGSFLEELSTLDTEDLQSVWNHVLPLMTKQGFTTETKMPGADEEVRKVLIGWAKKLRDDQDLEGLIRVVGFLDGISKTRFRLDVAEYRKPSPR